MGNTKILRREQYELPDRGHVLLEIRRKDASIYAWAQALDAFGSPISTHTEAIRPPPGRSMKKHMTEAARKVRNAAQRDVRDVSKARDVAEEIEI